MCICRNNTDGKNNISDNVEPTESKNVNDNSNKNPKENQNVKNNIIESFESDITAMSGLAANVMPDFMRTLEDMLNVNLYMEGLTNIFDIPEYNDLQKAKNFI